MPTYRPKYRGVQLSEALAQSAAIAPITYAMLQCFECRHPLSDPIRFVHNHESITAALEVTAPLDPGAYVTFTASSVERTRQEESAEAGSPEISLTISNVSGTVTDALKLTSESLVPWEITERLYASNDLTGPAILPPITLEITKVQVYDSYVVISSSYRDPTNIAVPKLTFKLTEYPGLYST